MKSTLYGKFLGRAPTLDGAKEQLTRLWGHISGFTVPDMPNGFFVIQCSTESMAEGLLSGGPWTVNGMIFHLMRWREQFQPAFEKLSTATVWAELHHLPYEYLNPVMLESVVAYFGKLVKVDLTTIQRARAKFARICVELNLEKPLKSAVWVNTPKKKVLVPIVYEKIPVFCYQCRVVGHGSDSCPETPPPDTVGTNGTEENQSDPIRLPESPMHCTTSEDPSVNIQVQQTVTMNPGKQVKKDLGLGSWNTAQLKRGGFQGRGRGYGRNGARGGSSGRGGGRGGGHGGGRGGGRGGANGEEWNTVEAQTMAEDHVIEQRQESPAGVSHVSIHGQVDPVEIP
ncbi:hypothetical protein J5N97_014838 [Dioscorea zingiberensis]|uniref:DUF4283 domain-containing protein n=1 Tax=Dioscorea zingiberensis TaxID=325984 RepID=A0A9D5CUV3_9LILI|nr:hypothetical protein J5N97_014838 [Dioscorea zingiberensis]